jgi:hypothetical protein
VNRWGHYLTNDFMKKSQLISAFVRPIIIALVSFTIRKLQKIQIFLSSEDSGLKNTWDEICVQIQGEYSFHWNEYEQVIDNHLSDEIKNLNDYERFAIWLQTDKGFYYDEDEDETPESYDEDIMHYLKSEIFKKAGNWSNHRIRKYLS